MNYLNYYQTIKNNAAKRLNKIALAYDDYFDEGDEQKKDTFEVGDKINLKLSFKGDKISFLGKSDDPKISDLINSYKSLHGKKLDNKANNLSELFTELQISSQKNPIGIVMQVRKNGAEYVIGMLNKNGEPIQFTLPKQFIKSAQMPKTEEEKNKEYQEGIARAEERAKTRKEEAAKLGISLEQYNELASSGKLDELRKKHILKKFNLDEKEANEAKRFNMNYQEYTKLKQDGKLDEYRKNFENKQIQELQITPEQYANLKESGQLEEFIKIRKKELEKIKLEKEETEEKKEKDAEEEEKKKYGLSDEQYKKLKASGELEKYKNNIEFLLEKFKIPLEVFSDIGKAIESLPNLKALTKKLTNLKREIPSTIQEVLDKVNSFDQVLQYQLNKSNIDMNNISDEDLADPKKDAVIRDAFKKTKQLRLDMTKTGEKSRALWQRMLNQVGWRFFRHEFKQKNIPETAFKNSKDALPHFEEILKIYYKAEKAKILTPEIEQYMKSLKEDVEISQTGEKQTEVINAHKLLGTNTKMDHDERLFQYKKKLNEIEPGIEFNTKALMDAAKQNPKIAELAAAFALITQHAKGQQKKNLQQMQKTEKE